MQKETFKVQNAKYFKGKNKEADLKIDSNGERLRQEKSFKQSWVV